VHTEYGTGSTDPQPLRKTTKPLAQNLSFFRQTQNATASVLLTTVPGHIKQLKAFNNREKETWCSAGLLN
jgi:hypothetical protein